MLVACGGDAADGASDATVLQVELGRYTISPAVLSTPAGELELVVTNVDEALVHNLVVNGKGTRQLAPGESQTLPMGEVGVGEYLMWCDVQGHAAAGQTGTLQVDPATAPTATTSPGG